MSDKIHMRAALKDVLRDLKKSMRAKRASRFHKDEEEDKSEGEEDAKVEEMADGRNSDGSDGPSAPDRDDGRGLPAAAKAKGGSSPFREEMIGFMTGRSLKTSNGKSAPVVQQGSQTKKAAKKSPPSPSKGKREMAG